jgi:hypothetical protein
VRRLALVHHGMVTLGSSELRRCARPARRVAASDRPLCIGNSATGRAPHAAWLSGGRKAPTSGPGHEENVADR